MEKTQMSYDEIDEAIVDHKLVRCMGKIGTIGVGAGGSIYFSYLNVEGVQGWEEVDRSVIFHASKKQKKKYEQHVVSVFESNFVTETLDFYVKLRRKQQKKAIKSNT